MSGMTAQLPTPGPRRRRRRLHDEAVLEAIRRRTADGGYPPTLREIAEDVGAGSSSSVAFVLDRLERDGRITRRVGMPRTVQVIDPGVASPRG